ncbi:MAG: ArnT family glycosyltransferase [Acidobacteriota bacterium]
MPSSRLTDRPWAWVLAAAILLAFGLGRMALLDPDECRYAGAARQMLATGDLIVPMFNGTPRLNKPPLIYWLEAASIGLLGPTETAARLPSLLAAVLTLGLLVWWTTRQSGTLNRGAAVALLATTPLVFAVARLAITDMVLLCCLTSTILLWHEACHEANLFDRRRLAMAASLSCGLAVLAKGPVGFLLPSAVIGASALLIRKPRMVTPRGLLAAACGIALVTGPWLAGLAARTGAAGILGLLRHEVVGRAIAGLDHPRPWYYLLVTFWPLFFPLSVAAPFLIHGALKPGRERDPVAVFLAVWVVVVLAAFSLVTEKNDAYLLPAAPALALLAARKLPRRLAMGASAMMAGVLVILVLFASGAISSTRSLRQVVTTAGLNQRGAYRLVGYKIRRPSLVYYSGRPALWVRSRRSLQETLAAIGPGEGVAVVMTEARFTRNGPELIALLQGFDIIGEEGGYLVLFREGPPPG